MKIGDIVWITLSYGLHFRKELATIKGMVPSNLDGEWLYDVQSSSVFSVNQRIENLELASDEDAMLFKLENA